jgi:hypothetical protein
MHQLFSDVKTSDADASRQPLSNSRLNSSEHIKEELTAIDALRVRLECLLYLNLAFHDFVLHLLALQQHLAPRDSGKPIRLTHE